MSTPEVNAHTMPVSGVCIRGNTSRVTMVTPSPWCHVGEWTTWGVGSCCVVALVCVREFVWSVLLCVCGVFHIHPHYSSADISRCRQSPQQTHQGHIANCVF